MYVKRVVLFFLMLFFEIIASNSLFAIEIKNVSVAINIAGKQRMYTQRLLKDYVMFGMGNKFGNPKADMNRIIKDFEDHMDSLYNFTKNPKIKESIQKGKILWKSVKKVLEEPPKKDRVIKLQKDLDALLKNADNTTKLFAKQAGNKSGEIINISGRQRMLSQRMAGLYMIRVWGIKDPNFTKKMKDAMHLFKTSLIVLQKYEKNTKEISELLKRTGRNFMFFEFMNRSKSKFIPSLIYKKSNEMLKDMNTATGLYAELQ